MPVGAQSLDRRRVCNRRLVHHRRGLGWVHPAAHSSHSTRGAISIQPGIELVVELGATNVTDGVTDATKRRPRYLVAALILGATAVIAVVLVVVLSENVVYFRTVSEAVHDRKGQGTDRFRLAGAVVPGSVHETDRGVDFQVTDGKDTVRVVHRGDPPQLFKAKAPVLCEGRWGSGMTFDSDRILIRHGAKYTPPKVNTKRAPKATSA